MTPRIVAAAALILAAQPARAGDERFDGRIRVGGAGVMCVREPCPRIGVMAAAGRKDGQRLARPLFAGGDPPRLAGSDADRAAVEAAWVSDACLVVEGRFTRPDRLDIRRVVGSCGPKD